MSPEEIAAGVRTTAADLDEPWDYAVELPPIDNSRSHASEVHTALTADAIRYCFDKNGGAYYIYREKHPTYGWIYHLFCQLDDGSWADRLIYKLKNVWYEETAFVPKDGAWQSIKQWLQNKVGACWRQALR
jgi:hypothetical protein